MRNLCSCFAYHRNMLKTHQAVQFSQSDAEYDRCCCDRTNVKQPQHWPVVIFMHLQQRSSWLLFRVCGNRFTGFVLDSERRDKCELQFVTLWLVTQRINGSCKRVGRRAQDLFLAVESLTVTEQLLSVKLNSVKLLKSCQQHPCRTCSLRNMTTVITYAACFPNSCGQLPVCNG